MFSKNIQLKGNMDMSVKGDELLWQEVEIYLGISNLNSEQISFLKDAVLGN